MINRLIKTSLQGTNICIISHLGKRNIIDSKVAAGRGYVSCQEGIASTTWTYKTITSTLRTPSQPMKFFIFFIVELSSCDPPHDDMDPYSCDPIPSMKPLFLNEGNPISGSKNPMCGSQEYPVTKSPVNG